MRPTSSADAKYENITDSFDLVPYHNAKAGFTNKLFHDLRPGIFQFNDDTGGLSVEVKHRGKITSDSSVLVVYGWSGASAHEVIAIGAELPGTIVIYVM